MNRFAGVISLSLPLDEEMASGWIRKIEEKFPLRLSNLNRIETKEVRAVGKFQSSSGANETELYFDGEIFNGQEVASLLDSTYDSFRNDADLILCLLLRYGVRAVEKLNGQYIIIYKSAGKLFVLNDHAGIQQLFYYRHKEFVLFASEIKFLLAHPLCPCAIDWETSLRRPQPSIVLSSFISYNTWFKDIYLLPEASIVTIDLVGNQFTLSKYWDGLNNYSDNWRTDQRDVNQVMEEYMALLDNAVHIRTQNDAKVVSFLSGGLDSSVICALAAKNKPLDSYSIITQTTYLETTTDICHKLATDLRISNSQFLVPLHEISYNRELWKQRVWNAESPVNHPDSLTKTLLHSAILAKDPGATGVLTGTGSDQYNGGLVRWVINDDDSPSGAAQLFLKAVKEGEFAQFVQREEEQFWNLRDFVHKDFIVEVAGKRPERNYWMYYVKSCLHGNTYSLLWDEVRASALSKHNTRFPFLDHRFTAFFAGIPEHLHDQLFFDKQILRSPSKRILPDYVINKHKAPAYNIGYDYRISLFEYLTSGSNSLLDQAFTSDRHPVIDVAMLRKTVNGTQGILRWNDVMHIINLALLEQLPDKDEADLDFFNNIDPPEEVGLRDLQKANAFLRARLSIKSNEELLALPLAFNEGCTLVKGIRNDTIYINKKNTLVYEIDDSYTDWTRFLLRIDDVRSAQQILEETGIEFDTIEAFFNLCVKDQIFLLEDKRLGE